MSAAATMVSHQALGTPSGRAAVAAAEEATACPGRCHLLAPEELQRQEAVEVQGAEGDDDRVDAAEGDQARR